MVGLGETYGDAPVLDLLTRVKDSLVGLSAFDVNGLLAMVKAEAKLTKTAHIEMELAPGSMGDNLTSSVFSGFEVAFLDLQARSLGIPLVELLGGGRAQITRGRATRFWSEAKCLSSVAACK